MYLGLQFFEQTTLLHDVYAEKALPPLLRSVHRFFFRLGVATNLKSFPKNYNTYETIMRMAYAGLRCAAARPAWAAPTAQLAGRLRVPSDQAERLLASRSVLKCRTFSSEAAGTAELAEPKKEINGKHLEKIDLRVARIVAARAVEGADRLLELKLDVGGLAPPPPSEGKAPTTGSDDAAPAGHRTVLSGIKAAYKPEELVGRHVIYVANLKV